MEYTTFTYVHEKKVRQLLVSDLHQLSSQEPKTDKDEEHCKKVNDTLNNPPKPGQSSSSGTPDLSNLDQGNLQVCTDHLFIYW